MGEFAPPSTTRTVRDYQRTGIDCSRAHLESGRKPILVIHPGGGKTFTAATLVHEMTEQRGIRTLWMAHRRELIQQAAATLRGLGLPVGTILSGTPSYIGRPVQVASVQTISRRDKPPADLVIWDECHHAASKSWGKVFAAYPDALHMGLSGTPWRLDGKPLAEFFTDIVAPVSCKHLVEVEKILVEPVVFAPPTTSLAGVHHRGKEFIPGELAQRMDKPKLIGDIVETWMQRARGKLTAAYAINVEHSRHIVESFRAAGVPAEHVDGNTPIRERDAVLARLARREILVMSSCECFTEGWDLPALECGIGARPTESLGLHIQMVARIMRSCVGKSGAIWLDHGGNFLRHGRVTRELHYSLTGDPVTSSDPLGLRQCPKCFRLVLSSRGVCKECGYDFAAAAADRDALPETADGQLEEYREPEASAPKKADRATPDEREAYFLTLCAEAGRSGDGIRSIEAKFQKRFGIKPVTVDIDGAVYLATDNSNDDVKAAAFARFASEAQRWGKPQWWPHTRFKQTFGHKAEPWHRDPSAPRPQPNLYSGIPA